MESNGLALYSFDSRASLGYTEWSQTNIQCGGEMGKRKSIVPLNDARDSFNLFQDQLVPTVTDARGETVCAIRQRSAAIGIGGCGTVRSM